MWFRLPEGCSGISVECQEFGAEVRDERGIAYFRAPDHFAPRILALSGFALAEPPIGSPDDLPKQDPLRDSAIMELSRTLEAQNIEIRNLQTDYNAAIACITALNNEKIELQSQLDLAKTQIASLTDVLEDVPIIANGRNK